MEEQNKKLEAIMNVFKELSYDEKRNDLISLIEWLWESEVYSKSLEILKYFRPSEEYMLDIYRIVMEAKVKVYEEWKEQEKIVDQQKMQEYMDKLNELSIQQKEKDEKEADELLNSI